MIKGTITYAGNPGAKVRGLAGAVKTALFNAGATWHAKDLPRHFDSWQAISARYPGVYKTRTAPYQRRKARIYGHVRLLEFSGTTRRAVTAAAAITGTSKRVRVTMPGANRALNFLPSKGYDPQAELTAINQAEAEALARQVSDEVAGFLNSNKERRVVRV